MNIAAATKDTTVRPLRPSDLEEVITIDSSHMGKSRHRFFEKRLAHAKQHPEDFIQVGVTHNGALVGFAFARILRGEFGREQTAATLDAVGVARDSQEHGVGRALMDGLTAAMRGQKVQILHSQAEWMNHGLLGFFAASGFGLAPRLVLERSVLTPLAEPVGDE